MSKSSKGEGIKIAQAAKDLGVTSVTIRRYLAEFDIETMSDENGIKVLPERAMDELHEIRRLKEDGMTNPQVLEQLEEMRSKPKAKTEKAKAAPKAARRVAEPEKKEVKKPTRAIRKTEAPAARDEEDDDDEAEEEEAPAAPVVHRDVEADAGDEASEEGGEGGDGEAAGGDGRSKHSLTCQTCGKNFEHMNPRLRDCLECYRAKRKERRRDKHKNVIQHPLAAQVTSKQQQRGEREDRGERSERGDRSERGERSERGDRYERTDRLERPDRAVRPDRARRDESESGESTFDVSPTPAASPLPMSAKRVNPLAGTHKVTVRNYRKAIEETRGITANLKRRLERPDLPENERRWLEQIYAYQLILHQGWRHLAEYKAGSQGGGSPRPDRGERQDKPDKQEV